MLDVIIVGGSYAGIAAALQLGRARRAVLVLDAGVRRNRFATAAHGFLGQDGRDPAAIVAIARAELQAYATVAWLDAAAVEARAEGDGFAVTVASGATHHARRVILASGIADDLPAVPGIAERWGTHVFHCPYCHGYELERRPLGVLAASPMSSHHALLVSDWGPTTLFTQGVHEPDAEQRVALARRGVTIERSPVVAVEGAADLRLDDGRVVAVAGLFVLSMIRLTSQLFAQLGCGLEDGPMGAFVKTDPMKETTTRNVFACGDLAVMAGGIAFAVADGARAGISAHQSLIFR